MVPHSLGLWGCADWEGLVQVYFFKTWSNYNVPKPLGARLDEKGLKPFRVLGSYFRNIFRCRFRCVGARECLLLGGELENETNNCCHPYKAQMYVAESYMAPPHPTEEADTIRPHHPPHTTTTGGAGGIPYHPPGGGELLGLQNTPSPWGWGGSSSLQSYIYIYIYIQESEIRKFNIIFNHFTQFPRQIRCQFGLQLIRGVSDPH